MSRRDFRHHEPKKPKKGSKKVLVADILQSPTTVEVIGKKRKKKHKEEGESSGL
jgi:hypothetical protein